MGILNRIAKALTNTKMHAASPFFAWSNMGPARWTERSYQALAESGFAKNVIAYRCIMQIASAAASVPWLLYNKEGHEIKHHPLLDLLYRPNPLQDSVAFFEGIYSYLNISGNAYIEAVRPHDSAAPTELYLLRPDRVRIIPGPSGLPAAYQYTVNGRVTSWPVDPISGASNIIHLKLFNPINDWYGMSPLEAAQISVDQHNAAGNWNQSLLNQGARPSGALIFAPKDGSPSTLSDEQMVRLREELSNLYQGANNSGRPIVLEGGLDWREMSLSPKDMDWIAGRNIAARDIALAFGVPAQLIGIPDSQTFANMAEARLALYEETVIPLLTRVISAFDLWLTPMFDAEVELDFDSDAISALGLRRDTLWSKLENVNFLTRNEKRAAAGYGPLPNGDTLEDGNSNTTTQD